LPPLPGSSPDSGIAVPPGPMLGRFLLAAGVVTVAVLGMPEIGLAAGVILAMLGLVSTGPVAERASRLLIQACVVLLGLRMDLRVIAESGLPGLAFAAATIVATLAAGYVLGRWLRVGGRLTLLVSSGTAICGGSAIAAVGSVTGATRAQMSVATGIVFLLNAAALYLFPPLGLALGLSSTQFGAWAGIAIHDISSVVSAGVAFDRLAHTSGEAVQTATVVKLTRVIWIIPICFAAAALVRTRRVSRPGDRPMPIPWFIGLFVLAAAARSILPEEIAPVAPALLNVARRGMAAALFLIGAGLTWRSLRLVGARPLVLGVALWVFLSVPALLVVRATLK
jgi:uncharacterized integral membrane protein (TIGR00698 family)